MALSDNLVGYWNFDEASGDLLDQVNSYDGTNSGADYGATGKIGDAYDFVTANSDDVAVGDTADLNFGSGDFSINIWMNADASAVGNEGLVQKNKGASAWDGWNLKFGTNAYVGLWISGSRVAYTTTDSLDDGAYHMVTVTRDGSTVQMYLDGSADGSAGSSSTDVDYAVDMKFGACEGFGSYFDGKLDECGVWKGRAISSSEVTELWNSGDGLAYPWDAAGTNFQINVGDAWKEVGEMQVNVGDSWKAITEAHINVGDSWKEVFS